MQKVLSFGRKGLNNLINRCQTWWFLTVEIITKVQKTAEILQIFKVHTHGVIDSKLLCEVVRWVTETLVAVKYKFSPRMRVAQHQI